MKKDTPKLGRVIEIDEARIKDHVTEVVRYLRRLIRSRFSKPKEPSIAALSAQLPTRAGATA